MWARSACGEGLSVIERVRIRGYRKFRDITVAASGDLNIFVGDNESGKSTILEAVAMALTGRINGRSVAEELSPYWFNHGLVREFFAARRAGEQPTLPTISIEVFLKDEDALQTLAGANHSDRPVRMCPGVELAVEPDQAYAEEVEQHLDSGTGVLPVEYFRVIWRTFRDEVLRARPRELTVAVIDSRTVRSTNAVDYHVRQLLHERLAPAERAAVPVAYRSVKEAMTQQHLAGVNQMLRDLDGPLDGHQLSLAMDQSSRSAWDLSVVPHVSELPFAMAGLGQQVSIKLALAMDRNSSTARVVTIEEPENHLSHTSLNRLVSKIRDLRGENQQIFMSTHSSYVLNRLGLDALRLVNDGSTCTFGDISDETVAYFRKLPGYDTLRLVLADRVVLVEGPSDEIVFERFYRDQFQRRPIEDGIDVLSMRGLSFKRCLELAAALDKRCVVLRDNDGQSPEVLRAGLAHYLDGTRREVFIGAPSHGHTLEPQLLHANSDANARRVLRITSQADTATWMTNNKTDAAIRIADSSHNLTPPEYIADAVKFIHHA
ncbi:MAG TPA: AAA family ATPase [Actinophytocola sp.]|uniref:ATP-dependent nuclease n=1 Tax=Actinophytocola sp. TaxID=1872138 RepID=UPI002DB7D6EC|nr:AAA family ATPase [Actinophytocola sp.]HEU5472705.1 AAA family ATPase [Actinophytocola sp.]